MESKKSLLIAGFVVLALLVLLGATLWDLTTAYYDNVSFNVSSFEPAITGLFFSSNGTEMYIIGSTGNNSVFQFSLSTPWHVANASYQSKTFAFAQGADPSDIFFNASGNKMYILDTSGGTPCHGGGGAGGTGCVYQYTLSDPWNVSSASYDNKNRSAQVGVTANPFTGRALAFNQNGSSMYVSSSDSYEIYQYSLSVAWDVSTATFTNTNFSTLAQVNPEGLFFNASGNKMYVTGLWDSNASIFQYTLSTPWNISTAVYDNVSFNVSSQEADPVAVFFNASGGKMFVGGQTSDQIHQYSLNVAPTVTLLNPSNTQNFTTASITFAAIPSDTEDLTGLNVTLYGNWSAAWSPNSSNSSAYNATQTNFTISGIPDGTWRWNMLVNDTSGLSAFAGANRTFTKDISAPVLTIIAPAGTVLSQTNIAYNLSANENVALHTCIAWVMRGASLEIANTTISCTNLSAGYMTGTLNVSGDASYVFHFGSNNTLGLYNETTSSFTVATGPGGGDPGGGAAAGGGGGPSIAPAFETPGTPKKEPACKPFELKNQEFVESTQGLRFFDRLRIGWRTILDLSFCKSFASVYPVDRLVT